MGQENRKQREPSVRGVRPLDVLRRKVGSILLAGVLAACVAFIWATVLTEPVYSATVTVYANHSGGEAVPPQRTANTYLALLQTRTTLQEVLEKAGRVDTYSQEQLSGMITAEPVYDSDLFAVTVTASDPEEAKKLVNAIAEVLPDRAEEVMEGATVRVAEGAAPYASEVKPNVLRYSAAGFLAGVLLMIAFLLLRELCFGVVDEKYLQQTYDLPVLTRVQGDP